MKRWYIIFLLVIFIGFYNVTNVEATDYNYRNVCNNQKSTGGSDSTCGTVNFNNNPVITTETIEEEPSTDIETTKFEGYDVFLLLDASDSMLEKGFIKQYSNVSTRKDLVVATVDKINSIIKGYDTANGTSSTVKFIDSRSLRIRSYVNKSTFRNDYNVTDDKIGSGGTNLQGLWKKAYDYFNGMGYSNQCKSNRIPIAIMITDGYPNFLERRSYFELNKFSFSDVRDIHMISATSTYYTMMSMLNLSQKICNIQIRNFGIGMSENDAFAKFLLEPNEANYNAMSNGGSSSNPSTLSGTLYDIVSSGGRTSVQIHDAIANFGDVYGCFRGVSDKRSTTFTTHFVQETVSHWKNPETHVPYNSKRGGMLWIPNTSCNSIKQISFKLKNGTWTTIVTRSELNKNSAFKKNKFVCQNVDYNKDWKNLPTENYMVISLPYNAVKNKINDSQLANIVEIKVEYRTDRSYYSSSISNPVSIAKIKEYLNKGSIGAYVGGDLQGVENWISSNIQSNLKIVEKKEPVKRNITKATHNSCVSATATISAYEKTNESVYNERSSGSRTQCGKISIVVDSVLTENINFNVNSPSSTYAGGGFTWGGAQLSSQLRWYYSYLNNTTPLFRLRYGYYKFVNNKYLEVPSDGYWSLTDKQLFTDSSCSTKLTKNNLDNLVWEQLKGKINNFSFDSKFSSVDSNDASVKSAVIPMNTSTNKDTQLNRVVHDSNNTNDSVTLSYNGVLKKAYIDSNTAVVQYGDNSPGSTFRDAGQKYYVPLKYTSSSVSVKLIDGKMSVIGRDSDFKASCSANVEQILYTCVKDCDSGNGTVKPAYRYRPINIRNPFNNKVKKDVPENWQEWYCGNDSSCKPTNQNNNQKRISESYLQYEKNNPLYHVTLNNAVGKLISSYNNGSAYFDMTNINLNGTSKFVADSKIVSRGDLVKNSYCKLGELSNETCDVYK